MWLSTDERHLLAGYYTLIGEIDKPRAYRESDLTALLTRRPNLASVKEYSKSASESSGSTSMEEDMPAFVHEVKQMIGSKAQIEKANKMLVARNMLTIYPHANEHGVIFVSLTLDGYDLGRRYGNWYDCSGLWFEQYRNHWIWLILSCVGGAVVTLSGEWLLSKLR